MPYDKTSRKTGEYSIAGRGDASEGNPLRYHDDYLWELTPCGCQFRGWVEDGSGDPPLKLIALCREHLNIYNTPNLTLRICVGKTLAGAVTVRWEVLAIADAPLARRKE